MTERAIIFSGEMVRAILSGQKTQTRNPIERVKGIYGGFVASFQTSDTPGYDFAMRDIRWCWNELERDDLLRRCPYGQIGSWLWVREKFSPTTCEGNVVYAADFRDTRGDFWSSVAADPKDVTWKPSIHMPRWASRITLEITDIRIQRVQEISYPDCESEVGINDMDVPIMWRFEVLWNSIYGEKGSGWDANPWVRAITFRRIKNG